jgi:hypothetical protein
MATQEVAVALITPPLPVDVTNLTQLTTLLPPKFEELRAMKPEAREALAAKMWFHDTRSLLEMVAPVIGSTKFLCEVIPVMAPVIRKLHSLAKINQRLPKDAKERITWKMIGHTPTTSIKTNDREIKVMEDDAIGWTSLCGEIFQTSPAYVNKLTAQLPALPTDEEFVPETAEETKAESDAAVAKKQRRADADAAKAKSKREAQEAQTATAAAAKAEEPGKTKATTAKTATGNAAAGTTAKKTETPTHSNTILIPAPEFRQGDVKALYDFLDGNGCSGLVPLDAVFAEYKVKEFAEKLERFALMIANAFHNDKLSVRVTVNKGAAD